MLLLLEWRVRAIPDAVPSGVGRFGPSIGFERLDRDSMQQYTGDLRVFFQGSGSVRRARDLQVLRDEQGDGSLIHCLNRHASLTPGHAASAALSCPDRVQ